MNVKVKVKEIIVQVAHEQHKELAALSDDLGLLETGLDSLCLAVIVARLDDTLGLDPFDSEEKVEFPVTVGDFVKLYENAAAIAR